MSDTLSKELIAKAEWVARLMQKDGIKPDQFSQELVLAYMDIISEKIKMIQGIYLTKVGAKETLQNLVLSTLTE